MKDIAILGGGAAGLTAAVFADAGEITLYEKNALLARKLRITGKGRCNLTNTAPVREMGEVVPRGEKFLRTALYAFPPDAVMSFFEGLGVPLKVERGGRVFPVSDRADDVAEALIAAALKNPRLTVKKEAVKSVSRTGDGFLIRTDKGGEAFRKVLIATGGASYPATGSTGDGYRFARELGHSVSSPLPSLVPLTVKEGFCRACMGLSLKNTGVRFRTAAGKTVYEDFGELLFTHFGVSGPTVLSASAYLDFTNHSEYRLTLDLKPALSPEECDRRVLRDLEENRGKDLVNALDRLLPNKMIRPILALAGLDEREKAHAVTREERQRLSGLLKALDLTVTGTRPLSEAIVTRGGVELAQIDPRSLESRLVPGLYFAGEVLDADALTGGFNLQIAFATGRLAGKSMGDAI